MKITIQDKKLLASWGEKPDDIAQIERASKSDILELKLEDLETVQLLITSVNEYVFVSFV